MVSASNAIADEEIVILQDCADALMERLASKNADDYYVKVSRQDQEKKNGGYDIDSLTFDQLVFFAADCLYDAAEALSTY